MCILVVMVSVCITACFLSNVCLIFTFRPRINKVTFKGKIFIVKVKDKNVSAVPNVVKLFQCMLCLCMMLYVSKHCENCLQSGYVAVIRWKDTSWGDCLSNGVTVSVMG